MPGIRQAKINSTVNDEKFLNYKEEEKVCNSVKVKDQGLLRAEFMTAFVMPNVSPVHVKEIVRQ